MKKIIILLCLGLAGCATAPKQSQPLPPAAKNAETKIETVKIPETKKKPEIAEVVKLGPAKAQVIIDQSEIDSVLAVFSEAIQKNSDYAGAYYNRAKAYFYKKEFDKSWQDVHKAESLGCDFNTDFLEALRMASGRDR